MNRGEKKVICNKFSQSSSVTCIIWPTQGPIIFGLADGKVRAAHIKTNKSHTLYATDSFVESLASKYYIILTFKQIILILISFILFSQSGTGFISGHSDGTIVRFYVTDDSSALSQV